MLFGGGQVIIGVERGIIKAVRDTNKAMYSGLTILGLLLGERQQIGQARVLDCRKLAQMCCCLTPMRGLVQLNHALPPNYHVSLTHRSTPIIYACTLVSLCNQPRQMRMPD